MSQYPHSLEGALGHPLKFRPSTYRAVRAFARLRPWRGTLEDRQAKFQQLHASLSAIYNVKPTLIFEGDGTGDSDGSYFSTRENVIVMTGRLSVVTFLHEWGHVLKGGSEFGACRWSLQLFKKCFPKSWERLRWEGHVGRATPRE